MNINEEGGMLVLFDAKFGVSISTKRLKMYRDPPLAWNVPSGVVVGDGGSLVYVPVILSPSTVGSMLGSRILSVQEKRMSDVCIGWSGPKEGSDSKSVQEIPYSAVQTILSNKSQKLTGIILSLKLGSVSEDIIVDEAVSKAIDSKDIKLLTEILSSFSFISEKCLVFMLKFLIELPEEPNILQSVKKTNGKSVRKKSLSNFTPTPKLQGLTNGIDEDSVESLCEEMDIDKDVTESKEVPVCVFSKQKSDLINKILRKPISMEEIMKDILVLGYNNSIKLVEYLYFLLVSGIAQMFSTENHEVPNVENICTWLTILFDANYQQFLMTADVEIFRTHMKIFSYAKSIMDFWHSTFNVEVLVKGISTSDKMPTKLINKPYSIEKITL
ncbi:hypothetical protein Avbf_00873 [Armadillidium vulgare]|nr:hypothetical protein Avbf_00873 [Armadillidium vulgare]